jgi:hypothetical protein
MTLDVPADIVSTRSEPIDVSAAPAVAGPAMATIERRPGSVRRTSTIDMSWPGGWGTQMLLEGRARDLLTPADGGEPTVLSEDRLQLDVGTDRGIVSIAATPDRPELADLVGARGGGRLRARIAEAVPQERALGTPLYLLLDDLAGATLVGGFAYSQWREKYPEAWGGRAAGPQRRMEGICTGFQIGSSGLDAAGQSRFIHDIKPVAEVSPTGDPIGWHKVPEFDDVAMRRSRRIDVQVVNGVLEIDSFFQDSSTTPGGGRIAVHEYRVSALADERTGELLSVAADPRVLPFRECPLAVLNVDRLVGTPLSELRSVVLEKLKGIDGCTHLNDALRALAEVPIMAQSLGVRA